MRRRSCATSIARIPRVLSTGLGPCQPYPIRYFNDVIEIRQTVEYESWFDGLRDRQAKFRILARIRRLSLGNFGDVKPVGEGISELRTDCGPRYRIYITRQGESIVVRSANSWAAPATSA